MAISASEKIFVDPNEEIVTVIERLLNSEKDRIILVIPQNSILLSSYISINILFREVIKSKKLAVIVTEDSYGHHIAERAGFIVVPKVSGITNEMWEESSNIKMDFISKLKDRKYKNLQNVSGEAIQEINESELSEDAMEDSQAEISNEEVKEEIKEETQDLINEESETINDQEQETIQEEQLEPTIEEPEVETETSNQEKELFKRYQKPRREPKMINIDGIEMLSGGDLKRFGTAATVPVAATSVNHGKIMAMEQESEDLPIQDSLEEELIRKPARTFSNKSSFTGMDFKRSSSTGNFFSGLFNKNSGNRRTLDGRPGLGQDNKKRIAIIASIALVAFAIIVYIVSFRLSSVDITLTLKKQDVSTQGQITIDTQLSTVDTTSFKIPGQLLQVNEVTLSRTGEANGQGIRGNKAKGVIDILNTLDKDISLKAGTKVTSTETNLVYVLTTDVTIGKAKPTSEGASATRLEDVSIEAEKPGTDYNIVDSNSNRDFKIEGYTSSQVKGSRYANISGGTSESFTSVSADNIKTVKEVILPDLQKEAETKLNALVPTGYVLLKETIKFEEVESKAAPLEGEESKDKTFSLTIKGKISGMAIKQADLESVAKEILKNNQNSDSEIKNIADLQIDKVETVESSTVLTISSKGSLTKTLDEIEIKEAITGLSMQESREYFALFEEIEKYRIVFAPQIVPGFLQKVPTDFDRINLKIQ